MPIYLNVFKSIQSTAELKLCSLLPMGAICKSLSYYLHLLHRSTFCNSMNENFESAGEWTFI